MYFWLLLQFAQPAVAQIPLPCIWGFATLAGDSKPDAELITGTYEKLLSTLGGRVTTATWEKLATSADPFGLPEQPGADLGGLRKNMRELKKLLEAKGWLVPEIRTRLLQVAAERAKGANQIEDEREDVVRRNVKDYQLDLGGILGLRLVPGTNLVAGNAGASGSAHSWRWFDPETQKTWDTPVPGVTPNTLVSPPTFLPNGKEILLIQPNQIWRIPLNGTTPDFTAMKVVEVPKDSLSSPFRFGADPDITYINLHGEPARMDLRTNTFVPVSFEAALKDKKLQISHWGLIPKTNDFFVMNQEPTEMRLYIGKVDDKGVFTLTENGPAWPNQAHDTIHLPATITWSGDGKTTYVSSFSNVPEIQRFTRGVDQLQPILLKERLIKGVIQSHFILSPAENLGAYILRTFQNGQALHRIVLFDPKTEQEVGSIPLKGELPDHILFTREGNNLLVTKGNGTTLVFNPQRYLAP